VAKTINVKRNDGGVLRQPAFLVLGILALQRAQSSSPLPTGLEQPAPPFEEHPPEPAPVLFVTVDKQRHLRVLEQVADPPQMPRRDLLGLGIEGVINGVLDQHECHGYQGWSPITPCGGQPCDALAGDQSPD
jgi:hypothetical protein